MDEDPRTRVIREARETANMVLGRLSLLLESQARIEFQQESTLTLLVAIKDALRQIADVLERS
jgi:hypothetical protein